mmetsp:Transcript_27663/g.51910  ORF Transcript_27663/g.51910 Transcript_27663/m.51910 type:complete len:85 (-) Transcript_27663:1057-1311(-)
MPVHPNSRWCHRFTTTKRPRPSYLIGGQVFGFEEEFGFSGCSEDIPAGPLCAVFSDLDLGGASLPRGVLGVLALMVLKTGLDLM